MSNELILDSLRRRMRAMHGLYEEATSTMTVEQVNHREREGILPMAFSLFHYINMQDVAFMMLAGQPPIYNDGWTKRIQPAIADHGKERTVQEMQFQQIGDYKAFIEYMNTVFARTEKWLVQLPPSDLERVVIPRPFPPQIASTFSARVAGEQGITVLDGIECWIYQHGLRHMGEIELARSFVGLPGMTS
ncbi:MAG: DinB family protein [Proteobacteria bacterium]|nr:DinB family protein [Pseudomonadota bacterium]MBU4470770.1 DinB family protein [Pseudomonadota bacterium]MCG2751502.1 DinB family protein [Desulfobacteraceae bacterium]